jgi:N-methylhydantoinase B
VARTQSTRRTGTRSTITKGIPAFMSQLQTDHLWATPDGFIHHDEVDFSTISGGPWDGTTHSYIPRAHLQIDPGLELHREVGAELDPVGYQVLRWRLWNVNLEHWETIKRVAGTPSVGYSEDFNAWLLTEDGDAILGGPSNQNYVGMSELCVKWTLENRSQAPGIAEGDVFLQNDPYVGALHQMDVALYAPVFWEGKLFCWVFSAAHQRDLGGTDPGSFCPFAPDIFSEPTPWPPVKVVDRGVERNDVLAVFGRQSRVPAAAILQLRSQFAGLHTAGLRMAELLDEHGPTLIKGVMRSMIRDASQAVSHRLLSVPDGRWSEMTFVTQDSQLYRCHSTLTKTGDLLTLSNEGTAPQLRAGNSPYVCFRSSMMAAAMTHLAWDQLYCPAAVRNHIRYEPAPGTITVATYPAAVTTVVGTIVCITHASQLISKMVLAGPDNLRARAIATGGLSNTCSMWATGRDAHGTLRISEQAVECIAGGFGAFSGQDGVNTAGTFTWPRPNCSNVEATESTAPVLYLFRREQENSGGPGRWRGGNTIQSATVSHKALDWSAKVVGNDQAINTSLGLAGGYPGHSGNWKGTSETPIKEFMADGSLPANPRQLENLVGQIPRVPPNSILDLGQTGIIIASYCAGGGFGDPLTRDPALVAADVEDGTILPEAADADYGVVLRGADVDEEGTLKRRAEILGERLSTSRPPARRYPAREESAVVVGRGLDALEVVDQGRDVCWSCVACGQLLGPVSDNFKLASARRDRDPHAVDSLRYPDPKDFTDADLVLREWFCPGCGTLLDLDVCLAADEPLWDFELHEASLMDLAANRDESGGPAAV